MLQPSEAPSGWTATPHTDTSDDSAFGRSFASCVGSSIDPTAGRIQQVHSDDFKMGDSEIDSDASQWQSASIVQAQAALFSDPKANECYQQTVKAELAANFQVDSLQATLQPGKAGFPEDDIIATVHVTATVTANGQSVKLFVDSALIAKGAVTATVDFDGVGEQITPSLSSGLVEAVAKRVANV